MTQTVPDISPLMPMHQDPLLVIPIYTNLSSVNTIHAHFPLTVLQPLGQDCEQSSIPWWRHQMEKFSALLATCTGNSPVPGEAAPRKGQWRGALMFSLIWVWINGWVNDLDAGDLRRSRAHYDVTLMTQIAKFMGPIWGPPGPCRSQMGPMLVPWTLLSG